MGCLVPNGRNEIISSQPFRAFDSSTVNTLITSQDVEKYRKIGQNVDNLIKIYEENNKLKPRLIQKFKELYARREEADLGEIATGNCCKNPCYAFTLKHLSSCPKCGGKVKPDFENGYTTEQKWDESKNAFREIKIYDQNVCDIFKFNNKVDKIDYDLVEFYKYFTKVDEKTNNEYIIIDGERFDAPSSFTLSHYIGANNLELFNGTLRARCTTYMSEDNKRIQIGQAYGYWDKKSLYEQSYIHMVYLFKCNLCGLQYHLMNIMPLHYRNKSLDNKITVQPKEENSANPNTEKK